jgi:2-oxoglutarate dehydrogenase E2 component (dihydrolipoamide succinyltransferase)
MVATDAEVMGWVEEQLQDNPEVTVDELFEGAKILKPDVAELNKRQFHARYPLQVKRRASRAAAAAAAAAAAEAAPAPVEAAPAAVEAAPAPVEAPTPAPAPAPASASARSKTTTDPDVMSWVEGQLKDNPDVSVDELREGAVRLNAGIADLTKRQFHARYPLQVKRAARRAADAAAGIKPRRRPRRAPAAPEPAPEPAVAAPAPAAPEPEPAAPEPAPAAAAPAPAAEAAPAAIDRGAVRKVLFDFAADITAADGTSAVVRVLAAVDDYIDRIG